MIRDLVIDSHLFRDSYFKAHVNEIVDKLKLSNPPVVLTFDNLTLNNHRNSLNDLGDHECLKLTNKVRAGTVILQHFYDKYDIEFTNTMEKMHWGKNILYLDSFGKHVDFFKPDVEEQNECAGFPLLKLCAYCLFGCKYCFLNVTYRKQRILTKHFNFDDMKHKLGNFTKRHGSQLLNCGETGDPRDIIKWLNDSYWNDVCNMVIDAGQKLFCLTKSPYYKDLYEDDKLAKNVIYACSLTNDSFWRDFERVTASMKKRAQFLKKVQDMGHEIRARNDPLHVKGLEALKTSEITDDVLKPIYETLDLCSRMSLEPTVWTFSTLRFKRPAFNLMRKHIPVKINAFVYEMGRYRLKREIRHAVITKVVDYAKDLFPRTSMSDCKDNVLPKDRKCICQL